MKELKPEDGMLYTDAAISQVGMGCLEFKAVRHGETISQEINLYSQKHGKTNNGWGTAIFSGSLPELITFIGRANTAIAILSQIGDIVSKHPNGQ